MKKNIFLLLIAGMLCNNQMLLSMKRKNPFDSPDSPNKRIRIEDDSDFFIPFSDETPPFQLTEENEQFFLSENINDDIFSQTFSNDPQDSIFPDSSNQTFDQLFNSDEQHEESQTFYCPDCNFSSKNKQLFTAHMHDKKHVHDKKHGQFKNQSSIIPAQTITISSTPHITLLPAFSPPRTPLDYALHAIFNALCFKTNATSFLTSHTELTRLLTIWKKDIQTKQLPSTNLNAKNVTIIIKSLAYCFLLKDQNGNLIPNISIIDDLSTWSPSNSLREYQIILLHIGEERWITITIQSNNDGDFIQVAHPFYDKNNHHHIETIIKKLYKLFKTAPTHPEQPTQQKEDLVIFPNQPLKKEIKGRYVSQWPPIQNVIISIDYATKKEIARCRFRTSTQRTIKKNLNAILSVVPSFAQTSKQHIGAFHALFNAYCFKNKISQHERLDQDNFAKILKIWRKFLQQHPITTPELTADQLYQIIQQLEMFITLRNDANISIVNSAEELESAMKSAPRDRYAGWSHQKREAIVKDVERLKRNEKTLVLQSIGTAINWKLKPAILKNINRFRKTGATQIIIVKIAPNKWITIKLSRHEKIDVIEAAIPFLAKEKDPLAVIKNIREIYFLFKKMIRKTQSSTAPSKKKS